MAIVLLAFAGVVSYVAMPALAGLLMVIGYTTIKPAKIRSVMKTGRLQTTVLVITFVLTMIIPLQYAVLVGVALAVVLHVVEQSNSLQIRQVVFDDGGRVREADPPDVDRRRSGDRHPAVRQPVLRQCAGLRGPTARRSTRTPVDRSWWCVCVASTSSDSARSTCCVATRAAWRRRTRS